MWASDLVDDPTPHPDPRRALRMLAERLTSDAALVAAVRGGGERGRIRCRTGIRPRRPCCARWTGRSR